MADKRPLIIGLGGTPRSLSSSERALAISLRAAEAGGADTIAFSGPSTGSTDVPAQQLPTERRKRVDWWMRSAMRRHHYCGGLLSRIHVGFDQDALDYAEDLRTDGRVYFDGLAVGCIVCAADGKRPAKRWRRCARLLIRCEAGRRPSGPCSTPRANCSTIWEVAWT